MSWPGKFHIQIESPRCLLRRFIAEDVEWLTDLIADPKVNCFLDGRISSPKKARREAEAMILLNSCCEFGYWGIQDKETGEIHGWTGLGKLQLWSGPSDEIEVSYVLRRASWGQGLATEAAGQLVRRALEDQWLDRIMAVIAVGNTASKRVLEKIGMSAVVNLNVAQTGPRVLVGHTNSLGEGASASRPRSWPLHCRVGCADWQVGIRLFTDRSFAPYLAALFFGGVAVGIALLWTGSATAIAFVGAFLVGLGLGAELDIIAYLTSDILGPVQLIADLSGTVL